MLIRIGGCILATIQALISIYGKPTVDIYSFNDFDNCTVHSSTNSGISNPRLSLNDVRYHREVVISRPPIRVSATA